MADTILSSKYYPKKSLQENILDLSIKAFPNSIRDQVGLSNVILSALTASLQSDLTYDQFHQALAEAKCSQLTLGSEGLIFQNDKLETIDLSSLFKPFEGFEAHTSAFKRRKAIKSRIKKPDISKLLNK